MLDNWKEQLLLLSNYDFPVQFRRDYAQLLQFRERFPHLKGSPGTISTNRLGREIAMGRMEDRATAAVKSLFSSIFKRGGESGDSSSPPEKKD